MKPRRKFHYPSTASMSESATKVARHFNLTQAGHDLLIPRSSSRVGRRTVEMTPRGKRGKLQKPKRVSHASRRAWKSGQKQERRIPTATTAAGRV